MTGGGSVGHTRLVRRQLRTAPVLTFVLLLLLGTTPAGAQDPPSIDRLAGDTRVLTAIDISTVDYAADEAGAVVLARQDVFADALSGGPLAAARRGPLLLTTKDVLAPVVEEEILRVLPAGGDVYLLGGDLALEPAVEERIEELGFDAIRLQGSNRYRTSLAIAAEAAPEPGFITIATGNDFPDALIAGSLACTFAGGVMVLTDGERMPVDVAAYLEANAESAMTSVGPAAETAVADPEVYNIAGDTAAVRSVVAAQAFYDRDALRPDGVALASVEDFPDALAGAPHAYGNGRRPLLLTPEDALPQALVDYIEGLEASGPSYIYGGVLTISESVEAQLGAALGVPDTTSDG